MEEDAKLHDPRNLIGDALAMEELSEAEHRTIFFDWVFGLKDPDSAPQAAKALLAIYRPGAEADHPMIRLLEQAMAGGAQQRGRTGRRRGGDRG